MLCYYIVLFRRKRYILSTYIYCLHNDYCTACRIGSKSCISQNIVTVCVISYSGLEFPKDIG